MSGTTQVQRPALCRRALSSSSFAEAFDAARQKLNELELDDETSASVVTSDPLDAMSDPGLDSAPASSLASPFTTPATPALDPDVADDFAFPSTSMVSSFAAERPSRRPSRP